MGIPATLVEQPQKLTKGYRRMLAAFAAIACLSFIIGGYANIINYREGQASRQERVEGDVRSCVSGNRLRAQIREAIAEGDGGSIYDLAVSLGESPESAAHLAETARRGSLASVSEVIRERDCLATVNGASQELIDEIESTF